MVQETRTIRFFRRPTDGVAAGDAIPFFWEGKYHLFHLTCPPGTLGTQYPERVRTSFRHAVSTNLVDWEELPPALLPGDEGSDADGTWTGSVVAADGVFHIFYTGHHVGVENPQTICHATSNDLIQFEKDAANPILTPDPDRYDRIDWRDPYVFWNETENCYWMLIAARLNRGPFSRRGCIVLATSSDLTDWTIHDPLYAPFSTFCPECPEMFALGDKWYLVYSRFSEDGQTTYRVADSPRGPWRTPSREGVDGRRFYAAKSTSDGTRRYIFGTIYERDGLTNDGTWVYGGDFGIPRELLAQADGNLAVRCPDQIVQAYQRAAPFAFSPSMGQWISEADGARAEAVSNLAYGELSVPAGSYLVECTVNPLDARGPFGILLKYREDLERAYILSFEPGKDRVSITISPRPLDPFWATLTGHKVPPAQVDGPRLVERELAIKNGRPIKCTVLFSGSIVEAFVDQQLALTYRIYDDADYKCGFIVQDGVVEFASVEVRQSS